MRVRSFRIVGTFVGLSRDRYTADVEQRTRYRSQNLKLVLQHSRTTISGEQHDIVMADASTGTDRNRHLHSVLRIGRGSDSDIASATKANPTASQRGVCGAIRSS